MVGAGIAAGQRTAGGVRADRKELSRIEKALERLARRETALHAELAEAGADYTRAATLDTELRAVLAAKTTAEDEWLALSERLES